jgi:hypothetical protein
MYTLEMTRSDSQRAVASARTHQKARAFAPIKEALWHVAMFTMESVIVFFGLCAIMLVMYALALN